ncbi:hypothetical protein KFU94_00055 [Chloroflexi bacterium TSY]|nr:hypothetical protein [Chloroflexi bacterium TSY]
MRLTLARLSEKRYRCLWSHHHLLLDGWSLSRSKFGVFDYFQSGEKGFWGHFFRSQLPKTANFISRNRLNFT